MNLIKKLRLFPILFLSLIISSCSSDDEITNPNPCLADSFELTETQVLDVESLNNILVSFDVTNSSSIDYNIATDAPMVIHYTITVTATDGSTFETSMQLPVLSLSAGGTTSIDLIGNYGAGRTYESYTISLSCN